MKYVPFVFGLWLLAGPIAVEAADPLAMRIESFLVAPSHTPSAVVHVRNLQTNRYQGTIRIAGPESWKFEPAERDVDLAAGASSRLSFMVKRGSATEHNRYSLTATAVGGKSTVSHHQDVMTSSAPYFKPEIDGLVEDWEDAIPVRWSTAGKKTVVRTYWNRRRFALLVEVEEDRLIPCDAAYTNPSDALQIALSAHGTQTGVSETGEATRFEFLILPNAESTQGACFQLAEPGSSLSESLHKRALAPLRFEDAEVAVRRDGAVTYYECSLPFQPMRHHIRPSEGREFCLSVLVHDPDGTGVRDWGAGVGLWNCERNRLAWSDWNGSEWGDTPPFDNKIPWGLCSSKY